MQWIAAASLLTSWGYRSPHSCKSCALLDTDNYRCSASGKDSRCRCNPNTQLSPRSRPSDPDYCKSHSEEEARTSATIVRRQAGDSGTDRASARICQHSVRGNQQDAENEEGETETVEPAVSGVEHLSLGRFEEPHHDLLLFYFGHSFRKQNTQAPGQLPSHMRRHFRPWGFGISQGGAIRPAKRATTTGCASASVSSAKLC